MEELPQRSVAAAEYRADVVRSLLLGLVLFVGCAPSGAGPILSAPEPVTELVPIAAPDPQPTFSDEGMPAPPLRPVPGMLLALVLAAVSATGFFLHWPRRSSR